MRWVAFLFPTNGIIQNDAQNREEYNEYNPEYFLFVILGTSNNVQDGEDNKKQYNQVNDP